MNVEWEKLEAEVQAGLQDLAPALDAAVPREVMERTKLATRIALDGRLLSERLDVSVEPAILHRVRGIVRSELTAADAHRRRSAWWQRNTQALSAMAAAAMVGICLGIVHFAGTLGKAPSAPPADALEQFAEAGLETYAADPLTDSLGQEMEELEQSVAQTPTEMDRLEDGLLQLDDMIDGLQIDETGWSDTL